MLKEINLNYEDKDKMLRILKALGNATRINILELLNESSLNVNELAEKLNIPVSTAALNIKILEDAGLVFTELQPGIRGSMKLSSRVCDRINFELYNSQRNNLDNTTFINMPIGNYTNCKVAPTCGLVSEKSSIGIDDDPSSFFLPERTSAQLLWFYEGFVEYRFPNSVLRNGTAKLLELSFEACSEAPFYRNNWPSDITLWVNDIEIGTWTSPGDLGGRRGKFNPHWWPDSLNQYGLLKNWRVDHKGTFLDENQISGVTLDQLRIDRDCFISVKIGIKEDAKNKGGVSLFGEHFGDYPQNINMRVDYSMK